MRGRIKSWMDTQAAPATLLELFDKNVREARQALTLRLSEAREVIDVGTARFSRAQ